MAPSATSLGEHTSESIAEKELDHQSGGGSNVSDVSSVANNRSLSQKEDVESGVLQSGEQVPTKASADVNIEQHEEDVVDWDGDDDPEHPYNMPFWRIVINSVVLSILGFLSPLSSCKFLI